MEVIGAAAGVVGVIGTAADASKVSYKALKRLRNAPRELQDLVDAASRLQMCIDAVKELDLEGWSDGNEGMIKLKDEGQARLLDLNFLIQYRLVKPGTCEVNRLAWTRHHKRTRDLVGVINGI